jgi:hypothetical protein
MSCVRSLSEQLCRPLRLLVRDALALREQGAEASQIDLLGLCPQPVGPGLRHDALPVAERVAQAGDVYLDSVPRGRRWILGPELVDQALDRDRFVGTHKQLCKESALFGWAEAEELSVRVRLEGPEYAEIDAPEADRRRALRVALSVH